MNRHLNLVKENTKVEEKRIFPRFPFSSLTFKANCSDMVFQVTDISLTGMQITLANGSHILKEDNQIDGVLHWLGREGKVKAKVVWVSGNRIGLTFLNQEDIKAFLSLEEIVKGLRPIHLHSLDIEKPNNLKSWLKAASVLELFVWTYPDGEYEKFQLLCVRNFVEWVDGKGVKTGFIVEKDGRETPLYSEDELTFEIDDGPDLEKVDLANRIIELIDDEKLPAETRKFIARKLSN